MPVEDMGDDSPLLTVSAQDPDEGVHAELTYSLAGQNAYFTMDTGGR